VDFRLALGDSKGGFGDLYCKAEFGAEEFLAVVTMTERSPGLVGGRQVDFICDLAAIARACILCHVD